MEGVAGEGWAVRGEDEKSRGVLAMARGLMRTWPVSTGATKLGAVGRETGAEATVRFLASEFCRLQARKTAGAIPGWGRLRWIVDSD